MFLKIEEHKQGKLSKEKFLESFQGWNAYAKWANTFNLIKKINPLLKNLLTNERVLNNPFFVQI